jgi:tetratricopeptide (TPR) repeat protein
MHTITSNHKAFNKVTSALVNLKKFHETQNLNFLEAAESALDIAINVDPEYQDAIFYTGIVKDLIGKPADSHQHFNKVAEGSQDSKIRIEARYNLAVSYYHRYGHSYLAEAEKYFEQILDENPGTRIRAQVYANLAQTYAMWMIPNSSKKQNANTLDGRKEIQALITDRTAKYNRVRVKLRFSLLILNLIDQKSWKKVSAVASNAEGMALMYRSDYSDHKETVMSQLHQAEKALQRSEKLAPGDWANTCDLGSLYMRLGYHCVDSASRATNFQKAIELLQKVIDHLRPAYGFAYYEIGRTYRLMGSFDNSIDHFEKSLAVRDEYRDVSRKTVEWEKSRAETKETMFP